MEATLIENIEATTDAAASADERYQWARQMAGDWSLCAIDALIAHAYNLGVADRLCERPALANPFRTDFFRGVPAQIFATTYGRGYQPSVVPQADRGVARARIITAIARAAQTVEFAETA